MEFELEEIVNYLKKQSLAKGEIIYICHKVRRMIKNHDENCDNFRYTFKDDAEGMKKYVEISKGGCCGYYDGEVLLNNGRVFWFGLNYGH